MSDRSPAFVSALEYVGRGWSVLPVTANKKPHTRVLQKVNGSPDWMRFQKRTASEDEIRGWFDVDPDTGIAVVTGAISELVVIDYDNGEPIDVLTPTVKT